MPNLDQKLSRLNKILCCLNIARCFFCAQSRSKIVTPHKNFVLPQYSIPQKKKKGIFKQSPAPTLAFGCWRRVGLLGKKSSISKKTCTNSPFQYRVPNHLPPYALKMFNENHIVCTIYGKIHARL